MKVLVFGNSGSGKSTFAKRLSAEHRLTHLDLDSIVWEPGQIAVQRQPECVAASLAEFLAGNERWVIEGCYGELVEAASTHCTELVFLNPGLETCLAHNRRREWEPHKYASKEAQDAMLEQLQAWVAGYYQRQDPWSQHAHRRIFDSFTGQKTEYRGDSAAEVLAPMGSPNSGGGGAASLPIAPSGGNTGNVRAARCHHYGARPPEEQ